MCTDFSDSNLFGTSEGQVACREMGYKNLVSVDPFMLCPSVANNQFTMQNVQCSGSESQLSSCAYSSA